MSKAFYLTALVLLTASVLQADTIRVGDTYYRDVYIRVSGDYYYIYHPEEGRQERVSRRRSDISEPRFDENEATRAQLRARYEANKAQPTPPAMPTPIRPKASSTEIRTVDGEVLKIQKRKRNLAEFESQLAHWRALDSEAQEGILTGLQMTLLKRTELRGLNHANAVGDIEALDAKRATVESQLDAAARARAEAVRQAQAEDAADYYLEAYENSRVLVGPVYHYYYDVYGNIRVAPTWWYDQDESLYAQAQAERERTRRRIDAAEETYGVRAANYGSALQSVEKSIRQRERDARAVISKAHDEQRRYGASQARVGALMEAAAGSYQPRVQGNPIETWAGAGDRRTENFTVEGGLWRLDCLVDAGVSAENFSVTVYKADTDAPFTRIAGADFLGMRMRIFDEPGTYYLVVDQGVVEVPYEINVSALIFN